MNTKEVIFNKKIEKEDYILEFSYSGEENDSLFDEKIMNDFFEENNNKNIIQIITYIRFLLDDIKENKMFLRIINKSSNAFVLYKNSKLILYEKNLCDLNNNLLDAKYTDQKGLDISYSYYNDKDIKNNINNIFDEINNLKNIKKIKLNQNEREMIELYKIFFKENPNFNDKDIRLKIQTMMSILSYYNISDNVFSRWLDEEIPISRKIDETIIKIKPLGNITLLDNLYYLNEKTKNKVNIISKSILMCLQDKKDINDLLALISNIICNSKNSNLNEKEILKISNDMNKDYMTVENTMKLIKKINDNLILSNNK